MEAVREKDKVMEEMDKEMDKEMEEMKKELAALQSGKK